jgi:tetratricopeptide (TPR) repeat protein
VAALVAWQSLTAQVPTPRIGPDVSLDSFERGIAADPENLRIAADYRQMAIAAGQFDRSIDYLEKLADKKGSGPNIKLSLALAYVDKVPRAGDIRKLYLGRDAVNMLTKAIAQQPTPLAYYIRGLINLYYNNFIYHRIPRGIEDFEKALSLATPATPMIWRAYVSMGDGYWRLDQKDKAREVWKKGLDRFPDILDLRSRLDPDEAATRKIVDRALDANNRVDTSLRGVVP